MKKIAACRLVWGKSKTGRFWACRRYYFYYNKLNLTFVNTNQMYNIL